MVILIPPCGTSTSVAQVRHADEGAIFVQGFSPDKLVTDVRIANCVFQPMKNAVTVTNAVRVEILGCTGLAQ